MSKYMQDDSDDVREPEHKPSEHDVWVEELDSLGAAATASELWALWARAPRLDADEAKRLWFYLLNQRA